MKVENAVTVEPVGEFELKGIRRGDSELSNPDASWGRSEWSRAVFAERLAKQVRYLLRLHRPRVSKPRDQNKRPFPWKFVNRRPIRSR
jgi:hypothetical protein